MLQNISNIEGISILNKKEQKTIKGGASGTCAAQVTDNNGNQVIIYEVSKQDALEAAGWGASNGYSNNWCCDSCGSASWMQGIS